SPLRAGFADRCHVRVRWRTRQGWVRPHVQWEGLDRLGQRQHSSEHLFREGRDDHHHGQADRLHAYRQAVRELRRRVRLMHVPPKPDAVGNSGFFVWADPLPGVGTPYSRGIEVQVLVNLKYTDKKTGAVTATSHGDLFSIHGATCKPDRPHPLGWARCLPSEDRAKGANEWNHYRVTANDGVIKLEVNGKEVSGVSECKPRKGYLALESEGSECRFRNLKIKELPTTNPKPEEIANEAKGEKLLFNGLDLDGWKAEDGAWKAGGGVLRCTGSTPISTVAKFGPEELLFDCKVPAKATLGIGVDIGGETIARSVEPGGWSRPVLARSPA